MAFTLRKYREPDFDEQRFLAAPDAVMAPAPADAVAPTGFHAMSIFPEYFKVGGKWLLAEESRMDCVPVYDGEKILVKEFRLLRKGEQVILGRTEDGSEGIYVHPNGFCGEKRMADVFAFRTGRSRETAFSRDYDELYDILRYDRDHGKIVWVMGPAFAFDHDAREAFSALIANGYVDAVMAGNALATHDLEAAWLGTALGQNIYTTELQQNGHYKLNRRRSTTASSTVVKNTGSPTFSPDPSGTTGRCRLLLEMLTKRRTGCAMWSGTRRPSSVSPPHSIP